jgi:hypothetical protein
MTTLFFKRRYLLHKNPKSQKTTLVYAGEVFWLSELYRVALPVTALVNSSVPISI